MIRRGMGRLKLGPTWISKIFCIQLTSGQWGCLSADSIFFGTNINPKPFQTTNFNTERGLLSMIERSLLSIFHINIQCLTNKIDEVTLFCEKFKFQILCFSEHWIVNRDILKMITFSEYQLISFYCRKVRLHGGVSIYVHKSLTCIPICLDPYCVEMHAEFCGVEVPRAKTIIITVYRPSTSRHFQILLDKLEEILSSLATRTNYLVLIGDFNKDILIKSAEIHALLDLAESFGLKAKIMDPTRVSKWTATAVDNIITDLSDDSCSFGILEPGLSDHSGQYICLHAVSNIVRNNYYFSRPVNDMGLSELRDHLISVDWLSMQTNCDVNTFATYLVTTYQRLIKLCFPLKKRIISNKCTISWFNDDLRRMRDSIAAIKIISDCTQDLSDKKAYQQARSLYKKSIMNAKQNAYSSYIAQSDNIPKDSWRFINCLRNKNKNNSSQKNTKFDANEFNSYFSNIADEILKGIDKTDVRTPDILLNTMPKICNNFFLEPTCDNEISNIINNLKNSNCTDVYGINSKILKETVSLILTPLTNFFNECLGSGVFPDSLKFSKIIPIQKKGDAALLDNYRPISIIPIFGKVLEILIKSRLTKYFEKFRVINEAQFGFRSGKATTQALLRVMELVVDGLENSEINMVTLCDLSKAFDCVSHTTLMTKLEFYGVRGIPHKLFSSYLSNRKQCSAVNNMQSAFTTVKHGVPQGSVLGPLLFIIYTNDFYNFINKKANCVQYADDTSLITSDRCINSRNSAKIYRHLVCL